MELALARIELMKTIDPDSVHWQMFKDNYLEKEREQIVKAFNDGHNADVGHIDKAWEYYNQTYNQNK